MGLLKLRLSMLGTLALIIGASTLFFTALLGMLGLSFSTIILFVIGFNILQWFIAPYMIDAMYGNKEIKESENPSLHRIVRTICQKTGIQVPRLMLANIPIPNAFAYGSPISGKRIAVTKGLMENLEAEEVEAVLGHEIGHLKHRDVQIMMFVSVLPAIFYYIGNMMMWSSFLGGSSRGRNNSGGALLIGFGSIAIYWILTLFVLSLSRLREYYADQHSIQHVPDGARKLSEALAKISSASALRVMKGQATPSAGSFKSLFISDPDHATQDAVAIAGRQSDSALVRGLLSREISSGEKFVELFSTHPNIVKRLRALQSKQ